MKRAILTAAVLLLGCAHQPHPTTKPTSVRDVISSRQDLWGDAALARPQGPTYEYFRDLLPPLRYVDAPTFRCYPLVLSAPGAKVKARLISDGSGINLLARQPIWKNEDGLPIRITAGQRREPFGSDLARLTGPSYADGYLPIIQLRYHCDDGDYAQEAFAAVPDDLSRDGAVLLRFTLPPGGHARVDLALESGYDLLKASAGKILDPNGKVLFAFDDHWDFSPPRNQLTTKPGHTGPATVLVFTHPAAKSPRIDAAFYDAQRRAAVDRWSSLVSSGTQISVPEPYVNNAWRSLICGTSSIIAGQMNYSASNQYARQYSHESGEAIRSMVAFGHAADVRPLFKPLFAYHRPGIELHDAGFLLRDLADYYFQTLDLKLVQELGPMWRTEVQRIIAARKKGEHGLLPREKYCSDIETPVISLNTNANCWRGLRDMSVVLKEVGELEESARLADEADAYRKSILATISSAWNRSTTPPFLPLAIGEEPPHDPVTATRLGSYWNLVINSFIGSGVLPVTSPEVGDILHYIQTKGGLCMGLTRVQSTRPGWINPQNIDDLYNVRYALALLERDDPDRALVSFYGKLAQGFTRDTFIDGESSSIVPYDRFGRHMGLPPNSAANASFLLQLRNLLVQDWDTDDDGRPDTLRLAFATPRAWLDDGKTISVQNVPTSFGPLSYTLHSDLQHRRLTLTYTPPPRAPKQTLIRFRLPNGHTIKHDPHLTRVSPETFSLSTTIPITLQLATSN